MAAAPPQYDGHLSPSTNSSLPPYEAHEPQLQPTYKIDKQYTAPLINVSLLKAHLVLLLAFVRLHEVVVLAPSPIDEWMRADVKWTLFLARAVNRFDIWVTKVLKRPGRSIAEPLLNHEIPPLDVLLCLHAYLLDPTTLYEDSEILHPVLRYTSLPLTQITPLIDSHIGKYTPYSDQEETWMELTGLPFDSPISTTLADTVDIICPMCSHTFPVHWLTPISAVGNAVVGTGYAQRGFATTCPSCSLNICRETFCVNRVAKDLAKAYAAHEHNSLAAFSNTLMGRRGKPLPEVADQVAEMTLQWFQAEPIITKAPDQRVAFGQFFEWKMQRAETLLEFTLKKAGEKGSSWPGDVLRRAFKSWRHPLPYSIDIPSAIMRQYKFTHRLHALSYTSSTTISPSLLVSSISSYHQFLHLVAQPDNVNRSLVPTLQIDLAWHTHMLTGPQYRDDCMKLVGRLVGHDDKVEEGALAEGFFQTARAWKEHFANPDPSLNPSSTTKPNPFSKIVQKLRPSPSSSSSRNPPPSRTTSASTSTSTYTDDTYPDEKRGPPPGPSSISQSPSPTEIESIISTQPSTHNAIVVLNAPTAIAQRRAERERAVEKGKAKSTSDSTTVFTAPVPSDGVDSMNFRTLGREGWDLQGTRSGMSFFREGGDGAVGGEGVLDGSEKRGDCCVGAHVSCSTLSYLGNRRSKVEKGGSGIGARVMDGVILGVRQGYERYER